MQLVRRGGSRTAPTSGWNDGAGFDKLSLRPLKLSEGATSGRRYISLRNISDITMDKNVLNSPVDASDRIESLDVLRGFAVLGILVMNIQAFAMPGAAYFNPTAYGDLSGINFFTWLVGYLFVDQKFLSMFSLLFGAGICLFADRVEARSGRSAGLHYRRMFWLLVFGLVHAYFLWSGDVLVTYALCGSVLFFLRHRSPRTLVVIGLAVFSVASVIYIAIGMTTEFIPEKDVADIVAVWAPDAAKIDAELLAYRSGWFAQQARRSADTLEMHTTVLPIKVLWQSAGIMLMGMACYRWHILSASRSDVFYRRLALIGFGVGLLVVAAGAWWNFAAGWSWDRSMFLGSQFSYWGSLAMAFGYVGLAMLAIRRGWFAALQRRLAAAGRMAFTNYIAQTLICTAIFYGHGLGLFGSVDRWQQTIVVMAVWGIQLWWSPLLLRRFRYGPLEWSWRALTYWRIPRG